MAMDKHFSPTQEKGQEPLRLLIYRVTICFDVFCKILFSVPCEIGTTVLFFGRLGL